MILGVAIGFGACLLLVAGLLWLGVRWKRRRDEERKQRIMAAVEAQMAAEEDLDEALDTAARLQRENDTRRGFIQGIDYVLNRLAVEQEPREGPAERAVRESREIYEDDA